jgi:hypothetical protein
MKNNSFSTVSAETLKTGVKINTTIYGHSYRKGRVEQLCLECLKIDVGCIFLNFLLNPARPIKPEPRRSMVTVSGTGSNAMAVT